MRCLGAMALAAAVTFACTDARAQTPGEFWTGNDLLDKIRSVSEMDRSLALGYVMGAIDVGQSTHFCTPQITAGQARDIMRQHLEAVPAARHMLASTHIIYTFKKLWPCEQRTPAPGSRAM